MNKKIERMTIHLEKNPNDYQTAISLLKERSVYFDKQREKKHHEMYRKISLYKKG